MSLWLIMPLRGLASGKSRLSGVLRQEERRQFTIECLDRTLDAFSQTVGTPARSIVVSPDEEALRHAGSRGAVALREHPMGHLNLAVLQASDLAQQKGATQLLIVAADLPRVSAEALRQVISASDTGSVQIIVDKTGTGTNGLLLPVSAARQFSFGDNSLSRHQVLFEDLGYRTKTWHDPSLAFDVDTPEDLRQWQESVLPARQPKRYDSACLRRSVRKTGYRLCITLLIDS